MNIKLKRIAKKENNLLQHIIRRQKISHFLSNPQTLRHMLEEIFHSNLEINFDSIFFSEHVADMWKKKLNNKLYQEKLKNKLIKNKKNVRN